jgi:CheY-like chemotaxis protein
MNIRNASPRRFNVLLVEDNEDDVLITKHTFKSISDAVDFQVARDGLEALAMLRREPPYADATLPHIILLDWNLPRMDGSQFLAELKRDERLKCIPTVILTTSSAAGDISSAYRNNASAFMTKPIDIQEFAHLTECFANFWLSGVAAIPATPTCAVT